MITLADIKIVSDELRTPFTENIYSYDFNIDKNTHVLELSILKNGQYLFVALIVNNALYPIEHIEFYMNESNEEIIQEAKDVLRLLSEHDTRYASINKNSKVKLFLEILENKVWTLFGYPNTAR